MTSFDVDDLETWKPVADDFAIPVRLLVGPLGGPGEESFDLVVCTGGWLAAQAARESVFDARHHLVVAGFDWSAIKAYLERRVASCEGQDWNDVAAQLSRRGYWEFEDYRP